MKTRVVTLMWGTAWDRYGKRFYDSFCRYWPSETELFIVTDEVRGLSRAAEIELQSVPGYREFMNRWSGCSQANGYDCAPGIKTNAQGYSFKFDAVKWMPQGLAPEACLDGLNDGDILVWLDADVETIADVPADWIDSLLGSDDVAALRRFNNHTEIGFYAMRMGSGTRKVLRKFAGHYRAGTVFNLSEWHSAFVWDVALNSQPNLKVKNLNPGGRGHVWPKSALAKYTRHDKGKRKPQ